MKKIKCRIIPDLNKLWNSKLLMTMRLTVLILLIGIFQGYAAETYAQMTRLTLEAKNSTVKAILNQIEEQSEFFFLYNSKLVDVDREVNLEVKNKKIDEILVLLFEGTNTSYKVIDRQIVLTPAEMESSFVTQQQQKSISGKVTDKTGMDLPGVTIVVKGTIIGTTTDNDGKYTLNVPANGSVLVFSFVGMKSQEISVAEKKRIDVVMIEEAIGIEEVVAIGYGTQSRSTLTTSISKMDSKVLENVPFANSLSALQGTVTGVSVQSTSGQPGAAPRIIVRGGTSINNPNGAEPLYIVDGVIRNDIDDVNSDDIESLDILKDAASTAIYGARGSNGVVLITTKSGKSGITKVTYKYDLTLSHVGKTYDMASAHDYIYYGRIGAQARAFQDPSSLSMLSTPTGFGTGNDLTKNTGFTTQYLTSENQYKLNEGWESMADPVDPSKTIIYKGTDWQDIIFNTGVSHNHNISMTGGTDKANFGISLGYMSDQGIAITTKYDRLSLNMNGEIKVRDNLSFVGRAVYSTSKNNQVYNINNIFFRAAGLAPTAKYTFEDGTLAPGDKQSTGNPAYHLTKNKARNSDENITLSISGHWGILPGLSFDPQISLWKEASDNYSFWPSFLNGAKSMITTRNASSSYSKWIQQQADAVLSYKKTLASSHNIDITLGYSYFGKYSYNLSASGRGASTDLIPTLNAISTMTGMSGSEYQYILLGYFARANYNYKQKYIVSLNSRYDGASQLGLEHKWGFFPGISLGWNVHEENFWSALSKNINRLKIRASYGITGNIGNLGPYQAQGAYSVGSKYLGISAIQNTVIPNPNLSWEQSKTLDFGADIGLFGQKVNIIFDYYHRITDRLITDLPLPYSTGFSSISTNNGSLENKGVEFEVGIKPLSPESNIQWKIDFNASFTKHKILKLPFNGAERNRVGGVYAWNSAIGNYDWVGGLQEGGRIGDLFAWKQIGIYATDQEALSAPEDMMDPFTDKTKYGGDIKYLDTDNNKILDLRDIVYMGNPYPKWTGGISNSLSYKGFDLYLRMDYMTGHTIYNYAKIFLSGQWAGNLNLPQEMVDNGWKKQGDIATRPMYNPNDSYNFWRGGDAHSLQISNSEYYESGDFLCIRELTLSYNLPSRIVNNYKLNNVRFNITGNNLYYFTKYTGMNPEVGGLDDGRYPIPKNLILGVAVTF